jgi:hypothetical protein
MAGSDGDALHRRPRSAKTPASPSLVYVAARTRKRLDRNVARLVAELGKVPTRVVRLLRRAFIQRHGEAHGIDPMARGNCVFLARKDRVERFVGELRPDGVLKSSARSLLQELVRYP